MNIADAFKKFFLALNGVAPVGDNIADVVRNGTAGVCAVRYEDETHRSLVLKSSTTDSLKTFRITVVDDGTLSASEIIE